MSMVLEFLLSIEYNLFGMIFVVLGIKMLSRSNELVDKFQILFIKINYIFDTFDKIDSEILYKAPASNLLKFLMFVYSRKTFELVFSEMISDGREEIFDALKSGEKWKARLHNFSLHLNLMIAVVFWFFTGIAKKLLQFWKLIP